MIKSLKLLPLIAALSVSLSIHAQAGSLDPTFSGDGKVTTNMIGNSSDYGYSVAIQNDGKIVVAGNFFDGTSYDFAVVRYTSTGILDNTFSTDGKQTTGIPSVGEYANSVAIQGDGKIIIGGYFDYGSYSHVGLARYNTNGILDTTFSTDGLVNIAVGTGDDIGWETAIQADGKILIAGSSEGPINTDFTLIRLNSDGSLDNSFDLDGIVTTSVGSDDDQIRSMALQSDGKIVVVGESYNGTYRNFAIARYNVDGSLDNSFDVDGTAITPVSAQDDVAWAVDIQTDGKIIVAGESNNGTDDDFSIVRYNPDGSLDNSFDIDGIVTTNIGNGANRAYAISLQSNGKILVAGSSYNGLSHEFAMARYNSDGGLDISFDNDGFINTGFGIFHDVANDMAIQNDGKIVLVGSNNNGVGTGDDFAVARYNNDLIGIEGLSVTSGQVFPNPSSGLFYISLEKELQNASLKLLNTSGSIVIQKDNLNGNHFIFDISEYKSEIYFIEIKTDKEVFIQKIIKK